MRPEIKAPQQFTIYNRSNLRVHAPLPEKFGFGISGDISAPFGVYALAGELNKLFALYGKDVNAGLTTTKFWTGMEQPEIGVDLEFRAYEDATKDVVLPVLTLAMMAAGTYTKTIGAKPVKLGNSTTSIASVIAGLLNLVGTGVNDISELLGNGTVLPKVSNENIAKFFNYLNAPSTCTVKFGTVFTLRNIYIANFNVEFTNQLDYKNMPMAADVSLSLTPTSPLGRDELGAAFGVPRGKTPPNPQVLVD